MLTKENRKLALKLKESFLIMRDKTSFNRSIRSAPLYRVYIRLTPPLESSILVFF